MLELKDFISETLKQIIDGVADAQTYAKDHGAKINPKDIVIYGGVEHESTRKEPPVIRTIDFDIAITTSSTGGAEGGIGIFVGSLTIGAKGSSNEESSNMSRIKFSIPINLPSQNPDRKYDEKGHALDM